MSSESSSKSLETIHILGSTKSLAQESTKSDNFKVKITRISISESNLGTNQEDNNLESVSLVAKNSAENLTPETQLLNPPSFKIPNAPAPELPKSSFTTPNFQAPSLPRPNFQAPTPAQFNKPPAPVKYTRDEPCTAPNKTGTSHLCCTCTCMKF